MFQDNSLSYHNFFACNSLASLHVLISLHLITITAMINAELPSADQNNMRHKIVNTLECHPTAPRDLTPPYEWKWVSPLYAGECCHPLISQSPLQCQGSTVKSQCCLLVTFICMCICTNIYGSTAFPENPYELSNTETTMAVKILPRDKQKPVNLATSKPWLLISWWLLYSIWLLNSSN